MKKSQAGKSLYADRRLPEWPNGKLHQGWRKEQVALQFSGLAADCDRPAWLLHRP